MNQTGYMMQCQWDGIAGLTLRKLSSNWNREDQVVTEYRTMPIGSDGRWNVLMFWGTGAGSGSCDLYFNYPTGAVLVLAETSMTDDFLEQMRFSENLTAFLRNNDWRPRIALRNGCVLVKDEEQP